MSSSASIVEEPFPHPPRYWWLKRISAGLLALLFSLILIRLICGWGPKRRLRHYLGALRAAREPVTVEDLTLPRVPDEPNFVTYIEQAAAAAFNSKAPPPQLLDKVYPRYPPDSVQWQTDARTAINGN